MVFLLVFGLFLPRLLIAVLYLFYHWFDGLFSTWIWPVIGFFFLPYTLLWYSVVMNWHGGVWGTWQVILLVIAVILDVSSYRGRL